MSENEQPYSVIDDIRSYLSSCPNVEFLEADVATEIVRRSDGQRWARYPIFWRRLCG